MARIDVRNEDERKAADAVQTLVDFVNGYNPENLADLLLRTVTCNHRTLQQSTMGALKIFIENYGKLDPAMYSDLRNEESLRWAKSVGEASQYPGYRFPLI